MVNASVIKSHSAPRLIPCTAEGDSLSQLPTFEVMTSRETNTIDEPRFDGREMVIVHDVFRREFALLPGLIAAVAPGDHARARNIADHIEALGSVPNTSVSYREGVT